MALNVRWRIRWPSSESLPRRENEIWIMSSVSSPLIFFVSALEIFSATAGEPPDFFNQRPAEIKIKISEDGVRSLRANSRKDVLAEVVTFGKKWREVPMHLKGSGTFQSIDERPSVTVEFWDSKIHLNNSADDPSRLDEFIGAYIFNAAGISAPKVGHGVLRLNGRRLGLYVIKQGFNSPSSDLPEIAVTKWHELDHLIDVDSFCAFMALEVMICHWDGYSLRGNNFHVSKEPGTAHYDFQPAGMDQLFGKPDFNWKPDMTGTLARTVMSFPEGRNLYEKQFRRLFGAVFDAKTLCTVIKHRVEEIRPILLKSEFESLRGEAADLCARMTQRQNYLLNELAHSENTEVSPLHGQKNAGP
jgi:spore coat protein H